MCIRDRNTVLTFTPIASLIAFNIYDAENNGDAVKSITFTPAGGEKLNGQHIYNLETGETTSTGTKESATVTSVSYSHLDVYKRQLYINTLHQSIPFRRGSGPEGVRDLPRCLPERFNGVSHRSANGEAGEESSKK